MSRRFEKIAATQDEFPLFYKIAQILMCELLLFFGLYKILFHLEALLHNNILCKHPLYCAIYCVTLPIIARPAQF